MKKNISTAGCIFAIIWFPILLVLSSIYHGFVLTKLWSWFVISTFNAPVPSLPAAIGLSLIVSFLAKNSDSKSDENESLTDVIVGTTIKAAVIPTLALITGYIVRQWM